MRARTGTTTTRTRTWIGCAAVLAVGAAVAGCGHREDDGMERGAAAAERIAALAAPRGWTVGAEPEPEPEAEPESNVVRGDRTEAKVVGGRSVLFDIVSGGRLDRVRSPMAVEFPPTEARRRCAELVSWLVRASAVLKVEIPDGPDGADGLREDCTAAAGSAAEPRDMSLLAMSSGEPGPQGRFQYWLLVGTGTEGRSDHARLELTLAHVAPSPGDRHPPTYTGPRVPAEPTG